MTGWPLPTQSRNSIWFLEVFEGEALFRKGPLLRGKQFHAFDSMSLKPRDKPNENIGHCSCMMTVHIPYGHGIHWTPFCTFLSSHFLSSGVGRLRRLHSHLLLPMGSSGGPCTDLALSPPCQFPSASHENYLLVFCFFSQPATLDQLLSSSLTASWEGLGKPWL